LVIELVLHSRRLMGRSVDDAVDQLRTAGLIPANRP
jgi:hypothetical protein